MKMNFAEWAQKITKMMFEMSGPNRLVVDGRGQAKKEEDKKSSLVGLCHKNKFLLVDNMDGANLLGG